MAMQTHVSGGMIAHFIQQALRRCYLIEFDALPAASSAFIFPGGTLAG